MSTVKDKEVVVLSEEEDEIGGEDENDDEVLDVFNCKYCEFQSHDIDELDEHIVNHDEAILDDEKHSEVEADVTEDNLFQINSPSNTSRTNNQENYDEEEFSVKHTIQRIKQSIPAYYDEFKNKNDKRVFVCPHCGYQTMKKQDMNKHLKVHSEPVEVPIYACAECTYTTRRKCDMPKHLLTHCKDGSVFMYKCNHCPYATKRKGDLPKHMLCHKKPDVSCLYRCHECTYSTRRRGDLKKHLVSHEHFGRGQCLQFNCTECGYVAKRLNDLHKHVVLHCDKSVKGVFKCPKCDYASEVGSDFARHILNSCQVIHMSIDIFPPDSEQDYIVLDEDELRLYQLDKESFASVDVLEKDGQILRRSKRKRSKSSYSSEQYYVESEQGIEESELLEEVEHGNGSKVLIVPGYEGNEKMS